MEPFLSGLPAAPGVDRVVEGAAVVGVGSAHGVDGAGCPGPSTLRLTTTRLGDEGAGASLGGGRVLEKGRVVLRAKAATALLL